MLGGCRRLQRCKQGLALLCIIAQIEAARAGRTRGLAVVAQLKRKVAESAELRVRYNTSCCLTLRRASNSHRICAIACIAAAPCRTWSPFLPPISKACACSLCQLANPGNEEAEAVVMVPDPIVTVTDAVMMTVAAVMVTDALLPVTDAGLAGAALAQERAEAALREERSAAQQRGGAEAAAGRARARAAALQDEVLRLRGQVGAQCFPCLLRDSNKLPMPLAMGCRL